MAEKIDITLSKKQFQYLGSLLEGNRTPLSPFLTPEGAPEMAGEDLKSLSENGVITAGGKISQKYKQTFSLLAGPGSFTWVVYGGIGPYASFIVFFQDKKSISLYETGDSFRVQDPVPAEELLVMLNQYFGTSFFSTPGADQLLSFDEAFAFFTLLDLRRRQLLIDVLENSRKQPPISAKVVGEWLSVKNLSRHWFLTRLREYLDREDVPSGQAISDGLSRLVTKGLVVEKGGTYTLSAAAEIVANRFMVFGNNLTLYSGRIAESSEVRHLKIEVINANLSDRMLWEITDTDMIHISFPSPLALTFMLSAFLENPDFVKDIQGKALAAAGKPEGPVCGSCNMPITPGSKFCNHCGKAVTAGEKKPEEIACAQCGRKLPPGAKFCDGCGKAIQ